MKKITKYIKELFRGEESFWKVFPGIFVSLFFSVAIYFINIGKILNIDKIAILESWLILFCLNIFFNIIYIYIMLKTKSKNKIQYFLKKIAVILVILTILFCIFSIILVFIALLLN